MEAAIFIYLYITQVGVQLTVFNLSRLLVNLLSNRVTPLLSPGVGGRNLAPKIWNLRFFQVIFNQCSHSSVTGWRIGWVTQRPAGCFYRLTVCCFDLLFFSSLCPSQKFASCSLYNLDRRYHLTIQDGLYFPLPLAGSARVRQSLVLVRALSSLAAAYIKTSARHSHNNFGLINHRKQVVHFNA